MVVNENTIRSNIVGMTSRSEHYLPKPEILTKHVHYEEQYRPGELFWGIGIEREFYLESASVRPVTRDWVLRNQKPERYSVRYFSSYKDGTFNKALQQTINPVEQLQLPVLFNAHAFLKVDAKGQHETTYEKNPKPNLRHDGKVLFEYLLQDDNPFFRQNYGKGFCFDGDSIEITTQNFYCTTASKAVTELQLLSRAFLNGINQTFKKCDILTEHLPFRWASANYGLANMWTNPGNVSIFNNGTYHINLTAPTSLDLQGRIADRNKFVLRHQKIVRIFQWLEPLLVAQYGTGDFLSNGRGNYNFPKGSLRVAMSRYIGCGTFDSISMPNGKHNTIDGEGIPVCSSYGWYKQYHEHSPYNGLSEIGLDINFNKHYNHGIELRIFDWFPESQLEELLEFLICAMDQALSMHSVLDARANKTWNRLMVRAVTDGKRMCIWESELRALREGLGLPTLRGFKFHEVWKSLFGLLRKWKKRGECCSFMLEPTVGCSGCF